MSAMTWFPLRISAAACKASAIFSTNHRAPNSALVPTCFVEMRDLAKRSKIELSPAADAISCRRASTVLGSFCIALKTSRHWTLPAPSQREFNGASRYRRGSGDSSMYPFPPKHSKASATTEGARFVIQYLAIGVMVCYLVDTKTKSIVGSQLRGEPIGQHAQIDRLRFA